MRMRIYFEIDLGGGARGADLREIFVKAANIGAGAIRAKADSMESADRTKI